MSEELLAQFIIVLLYIGGPLIPLLYLTINISQWHRENGDPPIELTH